MSLTDRLAEAAKARENGELVDVGPDVVGAGTIRQASGRAVATAAGDGRVQVILSPSHAVATVQPDAAAAPDAVCPTCARTGALGLVDLARRTADWSCAACGTMWRAALPAPAEGELAPPTR